MYSESKTDDRRQVQSKYETSLSGPMRALIFG